MSTGIRNNSALYSLTGGWWPTCFPASDLLIWHQSSKESQYTSPGLTSIFIHCVCPLACVLPAHYTIQMISWLFWFLLLHDRFSSFESVVFSQISLKLCLTVCCMKRTQQFVLLTEELSNTCFHPSTELAGCLRIGHTQLLAANPLAGTGTYPPLQNPGAAQPPPRALFL